MPAVTRWMPGHATFLGNVFIYALIMVCIKIFFIHLSFLEEMLYAPYKHLFNFKIIGYIKRNTISNNKLCH